MFADHNADTIDFGNLNSLAEVVAGILQTKSSWTMMWWQQNRSTAGKVVLKCNGQKLMGYVPSHHRPRSWKPNLTRLLRGKAAVAKQRVQDSYRAFGISEAGRKVSSVKNTTW